jgi:hypothetical protein
MFERLFGRRENLEFSIMATIRGPIEQFKNDERIDLGKLLTEGFGIHRVDLKQFDIQRGLLQVRETPPEYVLVCTMDGWRLLSAARKPDGVSLEGPFDNARIRPAN